MAVTAAAFLRSIATERRPLCSGLGNGLGAGRPPGAQAVDADHLGAHV